MVSDSYQAHLASKAKRAVPAGFDAVVPRGKLFPFQVDIVTWALRQGRCAIFADAGMGKSAMQLTWAHHVAQHTSGRVLVLAPLTVALQTVREAEKFGIPNVRQVRDQSEVADGISVTNYERLHRFDLSAFVGVVLDESSVLKAYSSHTKKALVSGFANTPYRLACSATPAPNDHLELGNHAEFLGVMSSHQMIARWFINDTSEFGTYRLKGHAVRDFWDWVTSWARCIGRPSDLGAYDDGGYVLPELRLHHHSVAVDRTTDRGEALIREIEASATALHRERRRTAGERAAKVAELVRAQPEEAWLLWVETDYDAEAVRAVLPDAIEVRGNQTAERKAELLSGFVDGSVRVLLTKPSIAGWGLNFQHCARQIFVGPSYSYEALYQAIRRCWRFGQPRSVDAHVVLAATEQMVWQALMRKGADHDRMKIEMFAASRRAQSQTAARATYTPRPVPIPAWLETR